MQPMQSFRRCHVCDSMCEASGEKAIRHCLSCGKAFAPFFYFNDQFTPVVHEGNLRAPNLEGQWRPIHGLTAYWQAD